MKQVPIYTANVTCPHCFKKRSFKTTSKEISEMTHFRCFECFMNGKE